MEDKLREYWKKYLEGTASSEEMAVLLKALEEKQNDNPANTGIKEKWENSLKIPPEDTDKYAYKNRALWQELKAKIALEKAPVGRKSLQKHTYKYAAVAAVLILFLVIWFMNSDRRQGSKYVILKVDKGFPVRAYTLPDGSKLWLNSASVIRYTKDFKNRRSVFLEGEAYFQVTENKQLPFTVGFKDAELKVTGTQFNIDAYACDSSATVHVSKGSVVVYNAKDTVTLGINDQLTTAVGKHGFYKKKVAFADTDHWKNGNLIFRNATLSGLIKTLERRYNVTIDIAPNVVASDISITAVYKKQTALEEVLKGLTIITPFKYKRVTENKISIMQKKE